VYKNYTNRLPNELAGLSDFLSLWRGNKTVHISWRQDFSFPTPHLSLSWKAPDEAHPSPLMGTGCRFDGGECNRAGGNCYFCLPSLILLLRDIQAGKPDTKALREAVFVSMPAAAAQQIPIQRLSPENKGALLIYIPFQAGYRSEKQSLTHIWLLVISLATSSSVLPDRFQV
jgi:hypothetical protein